MAGVFGLFDFTKPGKGVDPDEPEKRPFFKYFELLWRKLSRLVIVNLMYFVCVLPLIMAFHMFFFDPLLDHAVLAVDPEGFAGSVIVGVFAFLFNLPVWFLAALLLLSAVIQGPATCGLTYMLRNYVRSEHAWYSDFWQRARMNLRQGLFLGALDLLMFSAGFYNISLLITGGEVPFALSVIAAAVFLFYLAMRNTLYLMAVTVDLKNTQLLRNAQIFALAGMPRHLLTGVIGAGFVYIGLLVNGFVELLFLPLIGFSLMGFTSVFICYPLIDKHLIKPVTEKENQP